MTLPQSNSRPSLVRSKIRPPLRGSITIARPRSAVTVWLMGHHIDIFDVQISNA